MVRILKKYPIEYRFLIAIILLQIGLNVIGTFTDSGGFVLTPYFRIVIILFTLLYFIINILKFKQKLSFKIKYSWLEIFVYVWLFYALASILIGLINRNPIVYVFTDFVYIFVGALLFSIFQKRKIEVTDFLSLSKIMVFLGFICLFFSLKAPEIFLIMMVVLMFMNISKRRYLLSILLFVPYLILVLSSNRSQLGVFLLMLFLLFLRRFRTFFTKKSVVFIALCSIIMIYFLKKEIVFGLLEIMNPNSNIGYRINQIAIILEKGIDYKNPFFISITQRIIEAEAVFDIWTSNLGTFIFGSGSGAVIDGSVIFVDKSVLNASLLGKSKVHNIHFLPFSMIFRYGLIGLMLFFVLLSIVYRAVVNILNNIDDETNLFWRLFVIFWVFFSIPAASYLWAMPIFWIGLTRIKLMKT